VVLNFDYKDEGCSFFLAVDEVDLILMTVELKSCCARACLGLRCWDGCALFEVS
jgi:hypothetical protein